MAKEIFVDTSAWIAVADKSDNHHAAATTVYPLLFRSYKNLVTTNLLVAETHIALRQRVGFLAAMRFVLKIRAGGRLVRVLSNEEMELQAESILQKYDDQLFSYSDAVSFAVMQERHITDVFTYDRHFETMGFRMVG